MLLEPGFHAEDLTRLKTEAINHLKVSLREGNDEELGKEELHNRINRGHPYGHHNLGTMSALEKTRALSRSLQLLPSIAGVASISAPWPGIFGIVRTVAW